jgi:ATP-dependent 26S proteasome regulatory subunit
MATNRKGVLDPALEGRITLKVEFERPDQPMRREIWKKLLPEKMLVGPDVDLERLGICT